MSTPTNPTADPRLKEQLATMATESVNQDFSTIDTLDTIDAARLMNSQDATVARTIEGSLPAIAAAVDGIVERLGRGGRLIYVGSGTAGRLGVLDASECPPTFNTPPELVVGIISGGEKALTTAVEGAEDDAELAVADLTAHQVGADDVVVGISASGRTPYACAAVRHARGLGALTVGLSCNTGSELAAAADHGIEVETGPEFVAGSTRLKAGTAQKLVLNMLSTLTMVKLGKTFGNLMVDVRSSNEKLIARAWRIVKTATGAEDAEVDRAMETFDGEVKPSILALLTGADPESVRRALGDHQGRLRAAVAELAG